MILFLKLKVLDIHCCLVAKSCLTFCDPMDCSLPASSAHGISQARIVVWVAISFSKGSFRLRDQTHVSCSGRWIPYQSHLGSPCIHSAVVCLVAQSGLTLCDPMDYSLPGSSVHGDSLGKNTGVGCHALYYIQNR